MRSVGFTLIELLIVISIISILAVGGFINFKGFSSDQVTIKALGQVQTMLRLAQSNASSSTICNTQGSTSWSLNFLNDAKTIELRCDPTNYLQKTIILENASVAITGSACGGTPASLPFTISYSTGKAILTFSYAGASAPCLASSLWTFTISNTVNTTTPKSFNINRGGAIDVQ